MIELLVDGELAAVGRLDDEGVWRREREFNGWSIRDHFTLAEVHELVAENRDRPNEVGVTFRTARSEHDG